MRRFVENLQLMTGDRFKFAAQFEQFGSVELLRGGRVRPARHSVGQGIMIRQMFAIRTGFCLEQPLKKDSGVEDPDRLHSVIFYFPITVISDDSYRLFRIGSV